MPDNFSTASSNEGEISPERRRSGCKTPQGQGGDTGMPRLRRLRMNETVRSLTRETRLSRQQLVLPVFVTDHEHRPEKIRSMPGVYRYAVLDAVAFAHKARDAGIPAILIFGVTSRKAPDGSPAWDPDGCVPRAIRAIRADVPEICIMTDVCLCAYTTHGHCGLVQDGIILNDKSVDNLCRMALCHARAGAHFVAPSDMMDLRVLRIRETLDAHGFTNTGIMSYAVKYASAFYGPFRDAANSAPASGDRRTHQMDPANAREAVREAVLDVNEGADMVMVKPALAYLDIVRRVREAVNVPVAAYNVSGEYAMVKAAAANGWINEQAVVIETLTGMARAGADIIITYHALDVAKWLSTAHHK